MASNRRNRLLTALLALVSLLFMQLAVAGYACPSAQPRTAEMAAMAEAGMPCAETMSRGMDVEQPNLCQAHCQAGQQTADKYELPSLASAGMIASVFAPFPTAPTPLGASLQAPHLRRATAPPLAVQHCCFRI